VGRAGTFTLLAFLTIHGSGLFVDPIYYIVLVTKQIISFDVLHLVSCFQFNYGGIQAKTPDADSADNDNDIDIVSSWNIAECLPKATQVWSQACLDKGVVVLGLRVNNYLNHPYGDETQ
jgi:hypothetical protein